MSVAVSRRHDRWPASGGVPAPSEAFFLSRGRTAVNTHIGPNLIGVIRVDASLLEVFFDAFSKIPNSSPPLCVGHLLLVT